MKNAGVDKSKEIKEKWICLKRIKEQGRIYVYGYCLL